MQRGRRDAWPFPATSPSPIARSCWRASRRDRARSRFSRERGLPGEPARPCARSACTSSSRAPTPGDRPGRGAARAASAAHALDMGNAGTAMRLVHGLAGAADFRSTLVGDESLMRRPMERVARAAARDGRRRAHRGRHAAGGDRRRPAAARHRLRMPVASAQVKSAILLAGLYAEGTHDRALAGGVPRPHRTHAARASACASRSRACGSAVAPAAAARGARSNGAGGFLIGGVLHRRRAARRRRRRACMIAQRRHQSDAHRTARHPARHGRRDRGAECAHAAAPNRWRTCGCAARALRGIDGAGVAGAARDRRVSGVVHRGRLRAGDRPW